ncbi:Monodehydroascorbate reductase [Hibiscus syriacus]|uniref:Monodehydroascorbate reductase n=1 Tax=Hibiscus syriacus TaxID=106335 RepID=A0A6A2X8B9_HIBSY|nr:Monodehydroascorbate reductase [Hibiscus syriacus]
MTGTDTQSSFLGRINIRRNQVNAMDGSHEQEIEDLDLFQKQVSDRFAEILSAPDDSPFDAFLSISWIRKLLDVFLGCEAECKAILLTGRDAAQISKPPLDRLIPELLDRVIKALDICNAIANGLELVRHCQKLAEIAVLALEQKPFGEGQSRRAKKALVSLISAMHLDDKEGSAHKTTERNWSFGRRCANKDQAPFGHYKSLSWQVAKNWSAAKQIHAMTMNVVPPRGPEASEKKGMAGLLFEIQKMEKLGLSLIEFTDSFQYPGEKDKVEEVSKQVAELAEVCRRMEEGLVPLQMLIREVFHRLVRSRTEILDVLDQGAKSSAPVV